MLCISRVRAVASIKPGSAPAAAIARPFENERHEGSARGRPAPRAHRPLACVGTPCRTARRTTQLTRGRARPMRTRLTTVVTNRGWATEAANGSVSGSISSITVSESVARNTSRASARVSGSAIVRATTFHEAIEQPANLRTDRNVHSGCDVGSIPSSASFSTTILPRISASVNGPSVTPVGFWRTPLCQVVTPDFLSARSGSK